MQHLASTNPLEDPSSPSSSKALDGQFGPETKDTILEGNILSHSGVLRLADNQKPSSGRKEGRDEEAGK